MFGSQRKLCFANLFGASDRVIAHIVLAVARFCAVIIYWKCEIYRPGPRAMFSPTLPVNDVISRFI